jgi:hypothetical protein
MRRKRMQEIVPNNLFKRHLQFQRKEVYTMKFYKLRNFVQIK